MQFKGVVVSTKMHKTAVVKVERLVTHPLYKKRIRRAKNLKVHDTIGVKVGDIVRIETSRPISRQKHFIIKEVIKE